MVAKSVGTLFEARLWSKVEKSDEGCWLWLASVTGGGYGRFKVAGKTQVAHRVVYEHLVGPIPLGLTLDHLCRNRRCVRPDHLEPVTMRENVLRGDTITAENSKKTHCIRGHHLSGAALFVRRDGRRRCQICEYANQRRLRQKPEFKQRHAAYERMRRVIRKGSQS